ncbi:SpoIIE family protein phosphatase [Streptomyces sp. NPDC088258]|uniref:ATP-binding SpoIIE family protein phosphatase n=1 Tax=Streptomyces sp. NPDC088258 TaxID=3365849 RepID=UPI00380E3AFE
MNFTRWSARLPGTWRAAAARTDRGSVPAARGEYERGEHEDRDRPRGTGGERERRSTSATDIPRLDDLSVRDLLGELPALVALVYGPEHRVAYVNDAYATAFGPRPPGAAAAESCPELAELGLLPLLDQVLRSGKPRTVKSRKAQAQPQAQTQAQAPASPPPATPAPASAPTPVSAEQPVRDPAPPAAAGPGPRADRSYTVTCTPVDCRGTDGILIYAADVTDHAEAAERLRASERRHRSTVVTLQRSLLPQELEQPDDLRVAATYRPGGEDAAVGGDWYDVITLGAGRTALVIGDVMGRGVRAAAVMGQLRTAVRAYARLDLPPHEVLQLLDGLAAEIDASQIATCVYAVHDPNEGLLEYASAGHLPILVRAHDGSVRRAEDPTGPPLGTGGWLHTSGTIPLPPGSTAVLYTDGLVERRGEDIDEGVASLARALSGAQGSPQVMCDRLIRSLGITDDHDDDVAVLVLQHPARTGAEAELFHNAALDLLGGIEAAPRARAFATGVLASWRFPVELRDLGVLATSELVANSLQHGTPPMRLRLRRTDRRLIIEVTDGDDHLPRRRRAEPADEAGRGISIVATIASSWGTRRTPGGGKAVWCEFALPH